MDRYTTPPGVVGRTVPPIRPPRPIDHQGSNERFLREMLQLLMANAEARTAAGSFGEVTLKFKWAAGKITDARFYPETTHKPEE